MGGEKSIERVTYLPKDSKVDKNIQPVELLSIKGLNIMELVSSPIRVHINSPKHSRYEYFSQLSYIIHLILYRSFNWSSDRLKYGRVPLNNGNILTKVNRYPKDLMTILLDNQIVDRKGYKNNVNSFNYRINPKLINNGIELISCYDKKIINLVNDDSCCRHILCQFYNGKLKISINDEEINKIVEKSVEERKLMLHIEKKLKKDSKSFLIEMEGYRELIYAKIKLSLFHISNCLFTYSISELTGRHYNTLTTSKSELRDYLYYGSKQLYEIDISNAVAFFSLPVIRGKDIAIQTVLNADSKLEKSKLLSILQKINYNEISLYEKLVLEGSLYEYILETCKKIESRKQAKRSFFYYIYGKNSSSSEAKILFEKKFPSIHLLLSFIKSNFNKTRKEGRQDNEPGNALSDAIYKLESTLMIETIPKLFINKNPNTPIYTVHDAYLSTKNGIGKLEKLLKTHSKCLFGIVPSLKKNIYPERTHQKVEKVFLKNEQLEVGIPIIQLPKRTKRIEF